MAQDPLLVDQIQIEPGAAGTRLIHRATDGSLQFQDARITGGILLADLAGLRAMTNVRVVGKGGAGAQYTAIQAALDTIPATASSLNPYFVLVGPGVWAETINLVRDGVHLFGFGATIVAAETTANGPGAYHTVVIQTALGTTPQDVSLHNFRIGNIHDNYACVRVVGAAGSNVGRYGIRLADCELKATGASGHPLWATSANLIQVLGGEATSSGSALLTVTNCAELTLQGVLNLPALDLSYDTAGVLPSQAPTHYLVDSCQAGTTSLSPYLSGAFSGGNNLIVRNCHSEGLNWDLSGNRDVLIQGTILGNLATTGHTTLVGSSRGTLTATGIATVDEPLVTGSIAFTGQASRAVTLPAPQPNSQYVVTLEPDTAPTGGGTPWVSAKTAAGFTINFAVPQTMTVYWSAARRL